MSYRHMIYHQDSTGILFYIRTWENKKLRTQRINFRKRKTIFLIKLLILNHIVLFGYYILVWWFSVDTVLLTVCVLIVLALIFICNRNLRKRKIFNTEHLKRDDVIYKFNWTKFPVYLYTFSYPDPKCIRLDVCTRKIRGCWCTRRCILHCSPCTRLYL